MFWLQSILINCLLCTLLEIGKSQIMISQMYNSIRDNKDVSLFEMGEQSRDFVYVKDVARCNLLAGMSTASGIYNCGTGQSINFNEIFTILKSYIRNESAIQYKI